MRLPVLALALIGTAAAVSELDSAPELGSDGVDHPLNTILAIKQVADEAYATPEVMKSMDLGDSDSMSAMEAHAAHDARAEGLLIQADGLLSQLETQSKELGESDEEEVSFPKIQVRDPKKISNTVKNVVQYLGNLVRDGKMLTAEQIHEARQWYLDTTAIVLGRYAYEDQKADMTHEGAAGLDALKTRAEDVKQSMDKIDAAEHLHKMGAETWMDHSGTNILQLMAKTGRLARFLSEVENAEASKGPVGESRKVSKLSKLQKRESEITAAINHLLSSVESGDPITNGPTKVDVPALNTDSTREKNLMGKLMVAADKEDKARIVESAGQVAEKQISNVMKAAAKKEESEEDAKEKAAGIEVIHNAQPVKMVENDLAIPVDTLREHVASTVNKHLDQMLQLFKDRKEKKQRMSLTDYKNVNAQLRNLAAHLMQKYADKDEEVPFTLKMPLSKALTMPLSAVAWMRKKSHIASEHKNNVQFHKEHGRNPIQVGLTLPLKEARKVLAPPKKDVHGKDWMEEKNDNGFGSPFAPATDNKLKIPVHEALKMPLKHAVDAKEDASKSEEHKPLKIPLHHALKMPLKRAVNAKDQLKKPEQPQTPPTPPQAAAPQDPVTQFVWHTLGKGGVDRIQKAHSLADLLKNGVHLQTGGLLHFVAPQQQ